MGIENEILLYEMFHDYLKENGYTPDQDPDDYWEQLEDTLFMTFQEVIDEYEEDKT